MKRYRWKSVNGTDPIRIELKIKNPLGATGSYMLQRVLPPLANLTDNGAFRTVFDLSGSPIPLNVVLAMTIIHATGAGTVAVRVVQSGNIVGTVGDRHVDGGTALDAEVMDDTTNTWVPATLTATNELIVDVAAGAEEDLSFTVI